MSLDELLTEVKSFGIFQALLVLLVYASRSLMGWSMLLMSYAGAAPAWRCLGSRHGNTTAEQCPVNASETCQLEFASDRRTIVSEWDLVCDQSWIPNVVTSVQMAGVLVGAMASGQLGDLVGRKWTHYVTVMLHTVLNVAEGFSTSWQMFAVLRFFLGAMIGSTMVTSMTYTMELVGPSKRNFVPFINTWNLGVCLFALVAWLLHDWAYLHFALAALHLPFVLGVFLTPESFRWLVVQGRVEEAVRCLATVARFNRVPLPSNAAQRIAQIVEDFKKVDKDVENVSYLDLIRRKNELKNTLVVSFTWFTLSLVYYGLAFSAKSLAGNLYLNIFLLSIVDLTGFLPTLFLNHKIGCRWTVALWFFLSAAACVGILAVSLLVTEESAALPVKVLALLTKAGIAACWISFTILVLEIYPTKIRSLGYGWANTAARAGGIVAPFLINMETTTRLVVSYALVGGLTLVSGVLTLLLRETLGQELLDTLHRPVVSEIVVEEAETPVDAFQWPKDPMNEPPGRPTDNGDLTKTDLCHSSKGTGEIGLTELDGTKIAVENATMTGNSKTGVVNRVFTTSEETFTSHM